MYITRPKLTVAEVETYLKRADDTAQTMLKVYSEGALTNDTDPINGSLLLTCLDGDVVVQIASGCVTKIEYIVQ